MIRPAVSKRAAAWLQRLAAFPGEGMPPTDKACQLLCEDHVGTYTLPYLCQWSEGAWRSIHTGGTHQSGGGGVAHKLRGYSIVTAMRGLGTRSGSRFAKQIMAKSADTRNRFRILRHQTPLLLTLLIPLPSGILGELACAKPVSLGRACGLWSLAGSAPPPSENQQAPREQRAGGQRPRQSLHPQFSM